MSIVDTFKLTFQITPTPLLLVSDHGTIILSSEPLDDLFGYESGELTGQTVEVLIPKAVSSHHPELREAYFELPTRRAMGTGRDLYGVSKEGRHIPIEIALEPVRTEEEHNVLVSIVDISERKQGEEKIRLAIDAAANAMVMVDHEGKIVLTNAHACQLFGYDKNELLGQTLESLVPKRFRRKHTVYRDSYLISPTNRTMGSGRELFGLRRDGSEFPIEIGLTPIEAHDGRFVMSTIQDITQRKRAERELHLKNQELEQLNEELTQFSYSISHDLKAPLSSISGLLKFVASDLEKGELEEGRSNSLEAAELAERLAQRIEKVQAFVRSGFQEDEWEPVSVEETIRRAWSLLKPAGKGEGPKISIHLGHRDPIMTIALRLQAILENLISNSQKYADEGKPEQTIEVRTRALDDALKLSVRDNGIGIPEAQHGNVFKMFKRFSDHSQPGTGLGLALVKKNVDRLGGRIEFESSAEGTCFTVTLPQQYGLDAPELDTPRLDAIAKRA